MAARLMQAAGKEDTTGAVPGILCDEETYRAANSVIKFDFRPAIPLKGAALPWLGQP